VFARLPLRDNYFWRVYLTGRYSRQCCPEYLKPENFEKLKGGLVDRISVHTGSVQEFLEGHDAAISKFVLLDHMDWLSGKHFPLLEQEWQAIVRRASRGARLIWRSGGLETDFVNRARVVIDGQRREVGEIVAYHPEFARHLHQKCRVHTYGSFHIVDLAA
jgi:S-adenosylmethionine-diacylglycerol 3-amino-3-carboxypropyl transferase